ncbi:hypothetical protein N8342_10090 [Acidimicrobiales bacterium]|nr:hypothetical protein [Acidimicrobiales bacterium]
MYVDRDPSDDWSELRFLYASVVTFIVVLLLFWGVFGSLRAGAGMFEAWWERVRHKQFIKKSLADQKERMVRMVLHAAGDYVPGESIDADRFEAEFGHLREKHENWVLALDEIEARRWWRRSTTNVRRTVESKNSAREFGQLPSTPALGCSPSTRLKRAVVKAAEWDWSLLHILFFFVVWNGTNHWIAERFPTAESYQAAARVASVLAAISIFLWRTCKEDEGIARQTVERIGWLAVVLTLIAIGMVAGAY